MVLSITPWTNSSLCATAIYDIHRRRWRLSPASDSSASAVAFASVDRLVLDVNVHERSAVITGACPHSSGGPHKVKRARRGIPPCQEKGQGGAIPAVSVDVVNLNGQNECLLTVR